MGDIIRGNADRRIAEFQAQQELEKAAMAARAQAAKDSQPGVIQSAWNSLWQASPSQIGKTAQPSELYPPGKTPIPISDDTANRFLKGFKR